MCVKEKAGREKTFCTWGSKKKSVFDSKSGRCDTSVTRDTGRNETRKIGSDREKVPDADLKSTNETKSP